MLNINAGNGPKTILTFARTRRVISRRASILYILMQALRSLLMRNFLKLDRYLRRRWNWFSRR